ncbi:LPXTG cell wall anchor domain-containing protein [Methylorubrum populi]
MMDPHSYYLIAWAVGALALGLGTLWFARRADHRS